MIHLVSPPLRLRHLAGIAPPAVALTAFGLLWEMWTRAARIPVYLVPPPSAVLARLFGDLPFFLVEGAITLSEALAGFALGSSIALAGAIVMAHSRPLERSLFPLAVLVKVTPIIAVAPLFVIWFGFGVVPKVLVAALITFFPVLVNAITGFRSTSVGALEFLQSVAASREEVFFVLRVPSSLPYLFAAFKVAAPLAIIGAMVAEWLGADHGLGHVIILANNNLDMPTLFASILMMAALGIGLTFLLGAVERRVLFWHESSQGK